MPDTSHPCPGPHTGPPPDMPYQRLACSRHWAQVPKQLQQQVSRLWRDGDLLAYFDARAEAVAAMTQL